MMELEYIPLKTAEGVTCGHARVRGGRVELFLRALRSGEIRVLTDSGSYTGSVGEPIHIGGRVQAVALTERGNLRCCGVAREGAITPAEVALRLAARKQPPLPREIPKEIPKEAPEEKQALTVRAEPAPPRDPPDGEEKFFHPDAAVKQALSRLAEETAAEFLEGAARAPVVVGQTLRGPEEEQAEPFFRRFRREDFRQSRQEEDAAQTAADTETFSALMARADAVFRRIRTPVPACPMEGLDRETVPAPEENRREAPAPQAAERAQSAENPKQREASVRAGDPWYSAVDALLRAGDGGEETSVQNPFPHIFPGARFFREPAGEPGMLRGEWESGGEEMGITAVRGEYSPRPPAHLAGFTRYIRTKSGGFWVRVDGVERG